MRQFTFELKKLMKKKSIWIATALSLLAILIFSYYHFKVAESMREGNIKKKETSISQYHLYIEDAEAEKAAAEKQGDEEASAALDGHIERFKQSIENQERFIADYTNRNWEPILAEEIADLDVFLTDRGSLGVEDQLVQSFTLRATMEELQWLEKNGIEPVVQTTSFFFLHPTIYDQFTGRAQTAWEQLTARYGDTGFTYFYSLIPKFVIPIIILFGCFLFANSVSSENGKKRRSMQLHFVQPVPRTTIFLSKYFSGLFVTIAFVGMMLGAIILSGEFGNGIGSAKYPVLIYEGGEPNPYGSEFNALNPDKDQFHFIPVSKYVKEVLLLGVILTFVVYSLYFLLALAIRNPIITFLVTGAILFGGMKAIPESAYNPLTYVDMHRVLNGELAAIAFNPDISLQSGAVALGILGCFLFLMGLLGFYAKSKRIAA